jgi:hypothetical protein
MLCRAPKVAAANDTGQDSLIESFLAILSQFRVGIPDGNMPHWRKIIVDMDCAVFTVAK